VRIERVHALLMTLPPVHVAALHILLPFLGRVAAQSEHNRMDASNLGLVFAQALLRTPNDDLQREAEDARRVQTLGALLIREVATLIDEPVLAAARDAAAAALDSTLRSPPTKRGQLTKQGGSIKTWKRRFMVLTGIELAYFKAEGDAKSMGTITLEGYDVTPADKLSHPHGLCLAHAIQRNFYMCADTEAERQDWMRKLRSAVRWRAHFGPHAVRALQALLR
jgi:hypothetical protein